MASPLAGESSVGLFTHHIRQGIRLAKVPLSMFVAFSAVFGCCLTVSVSSLTALEVFVAVFLLSCASATLNNIQDRDIDAWNKRTRNRPLTRGRVTVRYALMQALCLFTMAMLLLTLLFDSPFPPLLGLAAVALYNGAYTPLKRRTLWAMVPGTLCGMLPPLIGWTSAAGTGNPAHIFTAMLILGFWQLPHTWLINFSHTPVSPPSRLPCFSDGLDRTSLKGIVFVWVLAFAVLTVMLFTHAVYLPDLSRWLVALNAVVLGLVFFYSLFVEKIPSYGRLFVHLNLALAVVMGLAVSGRFSL